MNPSWTGPLGLGTATMLIFLATGLLPCVAAHAIVTSIIAGGQT